MPGTDKRLEFVLCRMPPWGEELPVMLWLCGKQAVLSDAWDAPEAHDESSPACAHFVTVVVAQH